jgi:hypothetical protein
MLTALCLVGPSAPGLPRYSRHTMRRSLRESEEGSSRCPPADLPVLTPSKLMGSEGEEDSEHRGPSSLSLSTSDSVVSAHGRHLTSLLLLPPSHFPVD